MNITTKKSLLATMVGLFAATGVAQQAYGQDGEAATAQGRIDEIIVTANKREQSLQDAALALSAINGDGLIARGIENGSDLQFSIPGLTLGESAVGPAQVVIRGVGMDNVFLGGDPGVPVHINGHYIQDSTYILQDFMDVERVEVVRGPQGTLYGRNAIGGSINIITKRPQEEFEANASIDLGNYDKKLIQASMTGSLAPGLRGRIAISNEKRDGYIENISSLGGDDFLDSDYTSVRGMVEYDLTEDVLVTLSGYHFKDAGNTSVARRINGNPTSTLPGFLNYYVINNAEPSPTVSNPRQIRSNVSDDVFSRAEGGSLDIEWGLEGVKLRSLSSYNQSESSLFIDSDGSDVVTLHDNPQRSHETFSQEFQILSDVQSKSSWILGFFYYDEISDASEIFDIDNFFVADGSKTVVDLFYDLDSRALGLFGQMEYPFTDKLSIVGGLRYNEDKKIYTGVLSIPVFGLLDVLDDSEEWDEITGKLGINYRLDDDVLLYASYSSGYKAGGYNSTQPVYDPETVDAYELGLKGQWLNQSLQTNVSLFYYEYDDKQELQRDPSIGAAFITNAGAATLWGLELEGIARPFEGLMLDFSLAYLSAEYDEFRTEDGVNPQLGLQNLEGNKVPRSPEWKAYLGIQYEWRINQGQLLARVDSVWVDEQFSSPFNRPDRDFMDSYNRTNVQLTWETTGGLWQSSLYVRNLEDDDVISNLSDGAASGGLPVLIQGHYFEPRTYGLKITRHF